MCPGFHRVPECPPGKPLVPSGYPACLRCLELLDSGFYSCTSIPICAFCFSEQIILTLHSLAKYSFKLHSHRIFPWNICASSQPLKILITLGQLGGLELAETIVCGGIFANSVQFHCNPRAVCSVLLVLLMPCIFTPQLPEFLLLGITTGQILLAHLCLNAIPFRAAWPFSGTSFPSDLPLTLAIMFSGRPPLLPRSFQKFGTSFSNTPFSTSSQMKPGFPLMTSFFL